ncbi:TetR/AcrR family transcriptional regulator [Actinophytocola sp.]|uniref:TetR/AcrR family transcriptional regulator n=1 Tax=Actinophytocola sp. TaxID=1872138 RepID=UPI0025C468BE|nr:TetR/AcrR family transcriptional regulator [Actinophytocola sp.]
MNMHSLSFGWPPRRLRRVVNTSRGRSTRRAEPANGHGNAQRDRIRLTAVRLFTINGYAGTSMKQLANELGMVPANVYNYYPNKQSILFEVLSHQLASLIERDKAIVAEHAEPVPRMHALLHDLVVEDLHDPQAAFVGQHGLNGLSGPARERVSQLMAEVRQIWLTTVQDGVASGDFDTPDPKLSTLTILSLCSSTSKWFDPNGEYTAEEVADHTAAKALRGLGYSTPLPATKRARAKQSFVAMPKGRAAATGKRRSATKSR